jgi:uncharacterized protein
MSALPTPEPVPNLETEPFWDAAADGRLVLPRCDSCGTVIWYPRRFCPSCRATSVSWIEASGRGTVYSFTVVRKAPGRWREAAPYVIAYVELEEGPRVLTNLVDVEPDAVEVGMAVAVTFDATPEGHAVYRFRPA